MSPFCLIDFVYLDKMYFCGSMNVRALKIMTFTQGLMYQIIDISYHIYIILYLFSVGGDI